MHMLKAQAKTLSIKQLIRPNLRHRSMMSTSIRRRVFFTMTDKLVPKLTTSPGPVAVVVPVVAVVVPVVAVADSIQLLVPVVLRAADSIQLHVPVVLRAADFIQLHVPVALAQVVPFPLVPVARAQLPVEFGAPVITVVMAVDGTPDMAATTIIRDGMKVTVGTAIIAHAGGMQEFTFRFTSGTTMLHHVIGSVSRSMPAAAMLNLTLDSRLIKTKRRSTRSKLAAGDRLAISRRDIANFVNKAFVVIDI